MTSDGEFPTSDSEFPTSDSEFPTSDSEHSMTDSELRTTDRLRELLWRRVDGDLSPEERAALEVRLAAEPHAREEAEAVARLAGRLDAQPEAEPPAELRSLIDRAIARSAGPRRSRAVRRFDWAAARRLDKAATPFDNVGRVLRGALGIFGAGRGDLAVAPSPTRRLAYLAAGLILGALGVHVAHLTLEDRTPLALEEVYGTMHRPGREEARDSLAADDGPASLELEREGALVVARLAVAGDEPVTLTLGGGLDLVAFGVDGVAGASDQVAGAPDQVAGAVDQVAGAPDRVAGAVDQVPSAPVVRIEDRGEILEIGGLGRGRYRVTARPADPGTAIDVEVTAGGSAVAAMRVFLADLPAAAVPTFPAGDR